MLNFLRFSRPHTIIGTTLSITALFVLAQSQVPTAAWNWGLWAWALVACLGANIYIVGLNQITDIAIDRINKPYLPLASGAYSPRRGYAIIFSALLLSLVVAIWQGPFLLLTVLLSLLLGTAYSLPPFRLKRFYFWAAFCIIAVRGLIVNLLLFWHYFTSLGGSGQVPAAIWLLTAAIFVYSIVIAWFKDIPDMMGDEAFEIRTLSLHWGPHRVFRLGSALLLVTFLVIVALSWSVPMKLSAVVLTVAHLIFLSVYLLFARRLDLRKTTAVARFYQFVWALFFLEYLSFAFAGWLG